MYDKKLIIPGLIVFVALVTFPIWKNMGECRHSSEAGETCRGNEVC